MVPRIRPPPHLHAAECAVAQPGRVRVRRVGWTRARANPRRLVAQLLAAAARGQEDSERGHLRGGAAAAVAATAIAIAAEGERVASRRVHHCLVRRGAHLA
eukprot:scaffold143127_cov139-Phaeocystis_antarctica.AAC.2